MKTGKPLLRKSLAQTFERVCRFAGVPVFRAHAVRKRNVIDILAKTDDARLAQAYAGHSDIRTTLEHYTFIEETRVRNAAADLADKRRKGDEKDEIARLFGFNKD